FGDPVPCTQRTSAGLTQEPLSGFLYPVEHCGKMIALLFNGAFGLPVSGRSALVPKPFRVEPFATVNGVPDWNVIMPAIDQLANAYFNQPDLGPGATHRNARVNRCGRSKSLTPRSSFRPPTDTGIEVKFAPTS